MIKSINEISILDVALLDETKSAKHMRKLIHFPFGIEFYVPMIFLRKQFEKLATQIFEKLGNKSLEDIEKDIHKLVSYRELMILEALYKSLTIELNLKSQINICKAILEKEAIESKLLKEVLESIKEVSRIDIKTQADYNEFVEYIKYKTDKYKKTYPNETQAEDDPKDYTKLIRVIYGIFKYMDEPLNESMRLMTFIEMKEVAEEKYRKQLSKSIENGQYE